MTPAVGGGGASARTAQRVIVWFLIGLVFALGGVVDLLTPSTYVMTPIYAIPVLIAAWKLSLRAVVVIAVVANVVNVASALLQGTPLEVWLLYGSGLILIGGLAILVSKQKQEIAQLLVQQQAAHKELEQLRTEWTSMIAHDLRQPTTIILGYAGVLGREIAKQPRSEEETKAIEHVQAAARNLRKMIGDLLDVSLLAAGRLSIQREPVDLLALIKTVIERTTAIMGDHQIQLVVTGDIPRLDVDPARIEEVLTNLLSNAARYSFPQSRVTIEVARRDDEAEVSVTNRGPGIPAAEISQLFSRFYRTPEIRAGPVRGLGLGLYISKGIVEAHGGKIRVESTPGETTTFRFTLPLDQQVSPAGVRGSSAR